MKQRNYGFNPELEKQHRQDTDYLGSQLPKGFADEVAGLVTASFAWNGTRDGIYYRVNNAINHCWCFFQKSLAKYFPTGQLQNKGGEKMYCVTGGFNNEEEKQLNWAYQNGILHQPLIDFFKKYNFFDSEGKIRLSNRIPANLNGTGTNGNSLKRVAQWTENNGIFPQSILEEDVPMTFNEFYDRSKITAEMINIGRESRKYLKFNYGIESDKSEYPKYSDNVEWEIFDNYIDKTDGDFVKRLAEDYILMNYGYKVALTELQIPEETSDNLTNDMIKTAKFKSDKRVFLVSNKDQKDLLHIKDEDTWETFKQMGYVTNLPNEILPDTDFGLYNILPQQAETPVTAGLINFIKKILGYGHK